MFSFISTGRSANSPGATGASGAAAPFVILVASAAWGAKELADAAADGVVAKPAGIEQARVLIDRCIRLRLPSRVLVVDDSAT